MRTGPMCLLVGTKEKLFPSSHSVLFTALFACVGLVTVNDEIFDENVSL